MDIENQDSKNWEFKIAVTISLLTLLLIISYNKQKLKNVKSKFKIFLPTNENVYAIKNRVFLEPLEYTVYMVFYDFQKYFVDLQIKFYLKNLSDLEFR